MILISVDPGRNAGYAIFQSQGHRKDLIGYGTIDSTKPKSARAKLKLMRKEFRQVFESVQDLGEPDIHFVIEDGYIGDNKRTSQILERIRATIMSIAEEFDFEVHDPIAPASWQCYSQVPKHLMKDWVRSTYSTFNGGQDAAEAVAIGWYWLQKQWEESVTKEVPK